MRGVPERRDAFTFSGYRLPARYSIEDLVKPHAFEERIYRLRCVEAWSMVIPWLGFPLADLLKQVEPTLSARYVRFETLKRFEVTANASKPMNASAPTMM